MSKILFANDSDDSDHHNGIVSLKLNEEYAKSYNKFRQKEFYQKLKDQDKNNVGGSESSSDSESTDEEDEVVNPKFDQEFFRTLSSLKCKDPTIYDKNTSFFQEVQTDDTSNNHSHEKKSKHQKAFTLKDYERKIILDKNGKFVDDIDSDYDETDTNYAKKSPDSPSYAEEQKKLKNDILTAMNKDDSDEEFGGIFKKRQKTNEERMQEEEDFTKWLSGEQTDNLKDVTKKTLSPLKKFWSNPTLSKPEKFLRDYILNKGYVDKSDYEIPTYDQIVGNDENLSDDEKELEKQAQFEQKYNFRFEEPDSEFIKRYPRTIESSVRRTDDSRKQKRLETKERKLHEKQEKMKELNMLKELKRQEIQEKIQKLKEVTGNNELAFEENEFEDDFDPETHDQKMQAIFNDDYYGIDADEEKPECPDIDELQTEDWDQYDPKQDYNDDVYLSNCEDEDFNMDCDYNPNSKKQLQNELIENSRDRRKGRKKRNKFKEMIKKEKPVFNPDDEKTYEEYINEYYQMDCEDMIGDIPCRFKYVETVPNDFGLTIEEILLAKNKELNQWASLKKATQLRSEHVERNERKLYQIKAQNEALKRKIFVSLYGEDSDNDEKTSSNMIQSVGSKNISQEANQMNDTQTLSNKKKKRKRKRKVSIVKDESIQTETTKKINIISKFTDTDDIGEQNNQLEKVQESIDKKTVQVQAKSAKKKKTNDNSSMAAAIKIASVDERNPNSSIKTTTNPFAPKNNTKTLTSSAKKTESSQNKKTTDLKKKAKQSQKLGKIQNNFGLTDERLKAYGINPKKFNKKQNYLNQSQRNEAKTKNNTKK